MKKFLFDLFPLILFFAAYKFYGLYVATGVAMVASVGQIIWIKLRNQPIEGTHWINLGVIIVFGGATLWLQNEAFIKWKPTVLYAAMALALAVALWGMKKNMLRIMLGSQLTLPINVWHNLAIAWMGYCLFMAALNACMVLYFSTDEWMNFKLWGFVFPLVFLTAQGIYIARYLKDSSSSQP